MARDDVDFVVGDDAPRARPTGEAPPGHPRRRWLVLGAAAVVLVAAGLTVRGLTNRNDGSSAASSASPSLSASATLDRDSSTALDPSRAASSPLPTPSTRLVCPEFTACQSTTAIPDATVRAVRQVFPKAEPVSGRTLLLHRDNVATGEVRARLLTFRVGRVELFIRVSTPGADDDNGAVPVNTRTVIRTAPTGQYVTVEVAAQNGVPLPGYDVLQRLVADSRLLAA